MTNAQTISLPNYCAEGAIFAVAGTAPRTYRTGEEFEIDVAMRAERWSNGAIFALVPGFFGHVEINPSTVEFVAKT